MFSPEDLIFDKAILSENIEKKKVQLKELSKQQELLHEKGKDLKDEDEIRKNESSIRRIVELKAKIEKSIEDHNEEDLNSE